ncbi:MAG: glutamate--tRNA ligase [Desulfurococcales archaeon]|nr:glutamate--tRNA ligase [Desulfurococcales archaeon]
MSDLEELVRGYALKNAVKHGGRAQLGSVMSMILGDRPELKSRAREIVAIARRVVEEVNRLSVEEQRRELVERYPHLMEERRERKEEEKGLPPLPGAVEGRVVTRFAPNPDFVIHIGNARPAILSYEYARMYRGKMILRFEDTDPRTKTPMKEAYDMIRQDLKWLGVKWDEEYIQSLRLDVFYDVAVEMLRRGCAYVDVCGAEGKRLLEEGRYCGSRDWSGDKQLEEFDKMLKGHYGEGEAVVRVKTDPRHPNPSIRDWVALRIIDTSRYPHPLVGDRYIVWPTYNFAVSVDDHIMGVTHVLRGKEHQLNTEKQLYVYKCMEWEPPVFIHFGRLKLEGFIMSKSYIRRLMEENPGKFLGLDDPRFGTIAGLRRRGILAEAIRRVIIDLGVKSGDATLSWANLASVNRRLLDSMADRIMFVERPKPHILRINGCLEASIPYHPDRPERKRVIKVCDGDEVYIDERDSGYGEVRLLGLENFKREGNVLRVTGGGLEYAREKRLPIIQWVPRSSYVSVYVIKPHGLDLEVVEGIAEDTLREYGVDDRLQFIRYGFVRVDEVETDRVKVVFTHE